MELRGVVVVTERELGWWSPAVKSTDVGFSVENHTHIGHRGKEDDGGLMLRGLETPQGGE